MKRLTLLFFLFSLSIGYSQDLIAFKDGYTWPCKIVKVGASNLIFIRYGDKEEMVQEEEVEEFYHEGMWHRWGEEEMEDYKVAKYYHRPSVFVRKPNYSPGKFSISTNLLSLFVQTSIDDYNSYNTWRDETYSNVHLFTNRSFSIEPEYRIMDRFALRLPVQIGFPAKNLDSLVGPKNPSYYRTEFFRVGNNSSPDPNNVGSNDFYDNNDRDIKAHAKNLSFQIGIVPKFYPFGQSLCAMYLGAGAYIGMIDFFQNDYFYDLYIDSTTSQSSYKYLEVAQEKVVRSEFKRLFYRFEGQIGIDLNLNEYLGLGFQMAYSSIIYAENPIDRIFAKYDIDPAYTYIKDSEFQYEGARFGYMAARVHLTFRIGSKSNQIVADE